MDRLKKNILNCLLTAIIVVLSPCGSHSESLNKVIVIPGIDIKAVYRRLENAGFNPGVYNKDDFTQLAAAIARFQRIAKLETNGILDTFTWDKLEQLYDPSEASPEPRGSDMLEIPLPTKSGLSPTESLAQPAWPSGVIIVIRKMVSDLGYQPGAFQGHKNPAFESALYQFQKEHDLKMNGSLTRETLLAVFENSCNNGCEFNIAFQLSDICNLFAVKSSDIRFFSGTVMEKIFIHSVQAILNQMGYHSGAVDGIYGQNTHQALALFQKDHQLEADGQLNRQTADAVYFSYCEDGCEFSVFLENSDNQPYQAKTGERLKPVKLTTVDPDAYPVKPDDSVFAIERSECSEISGHWVILYEGVVTAIKADSVFVRLEKRLGYRYRPQQEGVDRNNWWCIPPRRHCYSAIKFSDWKGLYSQNQVVFFPKKRVYNAKIEIINAITHFIQQTCE